jgi:hypothetical protein
MAQYSSHSCCTAQASSHSCLLQDPPEYYDRPGGYLVYSADVPAAMIAAAVPATLAAGEKLQLNGTVAHFELVHHQLKQVLHHSSVPLHLSGMLHHWSSVRRVWPRPSMWHNANCPHAGT